MESAALIAMFSDLKHKLCRKNPEGIFEHDVPGLMDTYRKKFAGEDYLSESFAMILGSGPNGAIIHYKAEHDNSSRLSSKQPILCDTGGQYRQGTTDTTRTLLFGEYEHQREMSE